MPRIAHVYWIVSSSARLHVFVCGCLTSVRGISHAHTRRMVHLDLRFLRHCVRLRLHDHCGCFRMPPLWIGCVLSDFPHSHASGSFSGSDLTAFGSSYTLCVYGSLLVCTLVQCWFAHGSALFCAYRTRTHAHLRIGSLAHHARTGSRSFTDHSFMVLPRIIVWIASASLHCTRLHLFASFRSLDLCLHASLRLPRASLRSHIAVYHGSRWVFSRDLHAPLSRISFYSHLDLVLRTLDLVCWMLAWMDTRIWISLFSWFFCTRVFIGFVSRFTISSRLHHTVVFVYSFSRSAFYLSFAWITRISFSLVSLRFLCVLHSFYHTVYVPSRIRDLHSPGYTSLRITPGFTPLFCAVHCTRTLRTSLRALICVVRAWFAFGFVTPHTHSTRGSSRTFYSWSCGSRFSHNNSQVCAPHRVSADHGSLDS